MRMPWEPMLHYNENDQLVVPSPPVLRYESGNPADRVEALCGRESYRWNATCDPEEVTCARCSELLVEAAARALISAGRKR